MRITQLNNKCLFGGSVTNEFTRISVLELPVMIATLKLFSP